MGQGTTGRSRSRDGSRHRLARAAVAGLACSLIGCTTLSKAADGLSNVAEQLKTHKEEISKVLGITQSIVGKIEGNYDSVVAKVGQLSEKAKELDKDGDGKISLAELLGGLGGLGALLVARNAASDKRKATIEKEVAALKAKSESAS